MPLLLAEETPSFCHKPFLFFLAQGVSGTNGVYVHCIWVTRGGPSSLSALSKAMLPLVPCAQTPLVSHLRAKREDGFLGKVLAHLVLGHLLPLCHGFWPYIPIHDRVQCSWSQSRVESVDCAGIVQFPACFRCQGVECRNVVIDLLVLHFEVL
jgi:hypothetical protein